MSNYKVLLAKSWQAEWPQQSVPDYARLTSHLRAVELAGASIVNSVGELILQQLDLSADPWRSRLTRAMNVACLCHDIGKANDGFQEMVTGKRDPALQPARHELLSALMLEDKASPLRDWAVKRLSAEGEECTDKLLDCVIGAVAGHHIKLDEKWVKAMRALGGGCGLKLQMILKHSDVRDFFSEQLFKDEVCFSLIEGQPTSLAARRSRFNFNSNQWRERLKSDPEWWRFAAALKALVMAADVAGSAMAPKGADIAAWVDKTLSRRVNAADMKRVVAARLKGASPRPFQESIGDSQGRVTLVEAGCGTGKTAAAYMWAESHAAGKKLFFCYPTTGTATEGFLGYVHETEVEAELIHSRSIVDLAGIARVADDEKGDHLLRIESLNAWSPKVVICTADTVLALVRNNRRGLYNSPAILSGAFVFDELHAYDNTMLEAVVALIRALPGARFLLMTASLPKSRKEFLLSHIDIAEVPSPRDLEELPRYVFERCAGDDDARRIAEEYVARGKKVLWICNQVARAQAVFEFFKDRCPAANYHSRFKYENRVEQHRRIIAAFEGEKSVDGFVAVTTQVAEMSLDLDADLLISEVALIPALIQRLGRLNRRITPTHPGTPRKALFLSPTSVAPYDEADLQLADKWIGELMGLHQPLTQANLARVFNALATHEELRLNIHTRWLDSGWHAEPEPVRDVGYSVSVILAEDERACRKSNTEIIKRAIPMNYKEKVMQHWHEFKEHLIAPHGAVSYNTETGAKLA